MHSHARLLMIAGALALVAATPAIASPPWISIEVPPNPFDQASRGAFVVVRTYHHGNPTALRVSATAEGLVGGERRTIRLAVDATSRPAVFAIRKQWPSEGVWTLVIASREGESVATALVEIDATGEVSRVSVPTRMQSGWRVPREVAVQEVDAGLRARAQRGG